MSSSTKKLDKSGSNKTKNRIKVHKAKIDKDKDEDFSESSDMSNDKRKDKKKKHADEKSRKTRSHSKQDDKRSNSKKKKKMKTSQDKPHPAVIKPFYQSKVLDRSFKSPSESHRGSMNDNDDQSIRSTVSQISNDESSIQQSMDGGLDQSQASSSYLWNMYKQYMSPDEYSQSNTVSVNTGDRRRDESPISQNSISSSEAKSNKS
ncbi:MAG: hypothetical protein EZS28_003384 [Streblomastix strix]|uniref:Uncharacterized protein n=1 Tax=Streblomastix strix TaxID=222440 RepID=A0A5J4X1N1_9EUKA|nr:MAG: hypothetical protein EZS28_003384 [Streblomastix strix]